MEYVLFGVLGLGIPLAWTAAFFLALGARRRLLVLETRFLALEQRLAGAASAAAPAPPTTADDITRLWEAPAAPATPTPSVEGAAPPSDAPLEPGVATEPAASEATAPPPGELRPPEAVAPTPPTPPPVEPGLEERLGTRWVVWVGGVALALGAVFLVRYSIEQGLIGPGMRIFFGALFAVALIAAGEWTRRKENLSGLPGLPQASIPAILTAAGTTAAFATVWAAHGLYGFIGPAAAFLLLGLVALATLAAALLHGPALAGAGLIGAYLTPLLVRTPEPNFWALYLYLAVVTAAAFALARARLWRGLALAAIAFSLLWLFAGLGDAALQTPAPHAFHLLVGFALAAALIVSGFLFGPDAATDEIDEISSMALVGYLLGATALAVVTKHDAVALFAFAAMTIATIGIAWRTASATGALPVAAFLSALVIAEWAVDVRAPELIAPAGPTAGAIPQPGSADVGLHLTLGAALAALFGGAGFLAQGRYARPIIPLLWAGSAVLAPIAILIALYYRVAGFERSIPFAALALLMAALYATATEMLNKRERAPGMASAEALFAVGAVASLALALTFALEQGWLTVALALMAPGIAMIAEKRPLPLLRWLAAGAAALVSARVMWEPQIVRDIGTTPIFNWLLWGYGAPAVSFWIAAHLLRRRADDVPTRMLDAAAILFTVLTVTLEIRHYISGGDIYRVGRSLLAEFGLDVSALLAIAIGLERVRGRTKSPVHDIGAMAVAALALVIAVFGLLMTENPLFTNQPVGGLFFNLILLCYGLPAVLAVALALVAKGTRPMQYRALAAGAAVVLSLAYLTLQVRRFYQGPILTYGMGGTSDAELWTYSIVWLAFGVVLLLLGIVLRSPPARLASAAVILITVLKVFLYDLAGIGGVWRSLSFIGLGLVLVGIGWLYQKLLFPPKGAAMPPVPVAESPG